MQPRMGIRAKSDRDNNFGLIRLVLAVSVVIAHTYYLKGFDSAHKFFFPRLGTVGLGDLAVDGFFVISGFLITKSLHESLSLGNFIYKRLVRIFPGFIAAYLFSLFVVGPLAGGQFDDFNFKIVLFDIVLLQAPTIDHAFEGLAHPALNGSMWTIPYEFQCYLLVIAMGFLASKIRRRWHLLITTSFILIYLLRWRLDAYFLSHLNIHISVDTLRLATIFFIGSEFFIWRDKVLYNKYILSISLLMLALLCNIHQICEIVFAILGGYILLYFASFGFYTTISRFANKFDLSYGIYLYAWPEQNLIIYYFPNISNISLIIFSLIIAFVFGALSWVFIERPFLYTKYQHTVKIKPSIGEAI